MLNKLTPVMRLPNTLLLSTALAATFGMAGASVSALADTPNVVTSIKPLHSIAAAVMEGVGTPEVLIDGGASPHGFALKPSQAALLEQADAVFWIGPGLSATLEKPITSMATKAEKVSLMEAPGVEHLGLREGANFDAHDHDHDHGHGEHADHDDDKHDDHDHEQHADHGDHDHDDHDHDDHDHDHDHEKHEEDASHDHDDHDDHDHEKHADHDGHDHDDHDDEKHADSASHDDDDHDHAHGGEEDAHIWLDPDNGIAIAGQMAKTLSALDPDNAETYQANAAKFSKRIEELEHEIEHMLEPAKGKPFIVFHDAYHYFEHHFDIEASGAITVSPEALSSADRVAEVRERIKDLQVACVFQEPQFEAKLVNVVLEGSNARKGTLDPLGSSLQNGPDLYPDLLKGLAVSFADCLAG